jgi:hypothetical protein
MENIFTQRILNANNLFDGSFMEGKVLYLHLFNQLPSLHFIGNIDGEKTFNSFCEKMGGQIRTIHQYRWYKMKKKKFQFDKTLVVLENNCLLEFDDSYCEIIHDGKQEAFIESVTGICKQFKIRKKRQPMEINLVVRERGDYELRTMEVKKTRLDLDLYYEDELKETDALIQKRLNNKKDKGIVLLHGLPGTGKTTYLRYLAGKIKKRVLFLSPSVAGSLVSPDFMDLLIDNPETVLIIEDAENILMDRRQYAGSAVSGLLNISDGLLADFLNVQLICTFNSALHMVDNALMRKGRLIARHEFGKLPVEKAQRLSDKLGFKQRITEPMTLAEIAHPGEKKEEPVINTIGFRSHALVSC